jgi:hypothetical protein|nr:MAG TPA: Hint (Hedgehog/Intein) domain N-terminal region [Bacteriophage sp.]
MIDSGDILIAGVCTGIAAYKDTDDIVSSGNFYVANGKGSAQQAIPIYVYDKVESIVKAETSLLNESVYNIYGITTPANIDVHLSSCNPPYSLNSLYSNIVSAVTSDSGGSYRFEGVRGIEGNIIVWSKIDIVDATSATISILKEVISTETDAQEILSYSFHRAGVDHSVCGMCGGSGRIYAGDVCPTCLGEKYIHEIKTCTACAGSGVTSDNQTCAECDGNKVVDVSTACSDCGGTGVVQPIVCPDCGGDGYACSTCNSTGTIDSYACPECMGSGLLPITFSNTTYVLTGTCPEDVTEVRLSRLEFNKNTILPLSSYGNLEYYLDGTYYIEYSKGDSGSESAERAYDTFKMMAEPEYSNSTGADVFDTVLFPVVVRWGNAYFESNAYCVRYEDSQDRFCAVVGNCSLSEIDVGQNYEESVEPFCITLSGSWESGFNRLFIVTNDRNLDGAYVDIEIYTYPHSDATDFSETSLRGSYITSVSPSNGTYSIRCDVYQPSDIVVWAHTKSDEIITIDNVTSSNTGAVCLSGDTMIMMADGAKKRMDEISVGDMLLSMDGTPTRVYRTSRGYFNDYHTLYYFDNGSVIDETHDHRFYNHTQGFWQLLKKWHVGDFAVDAHGKFTRLVSSSKVSERCEMFGIWTDSGSYYANGLLSGSAFCNMSLLADATATQAVDMMLSLEERNLCQLIGIEEYV